MKLHYSQDNALTTLCRETVSRRRLPVNLIQENLGLFNHELERVIPETRLLALNDVRVSSDGILFRRYKMLTESFAFPSNMEQWKRRSRLKFFLNNYFLRRSRTIERDVLWIVDDWSNGYFHWLTDVLTRLYVVRDRLDDFVLLLPWDYEARDFVQPSLRCFGVKSVEFIRQNEVLRCRKVFMPTHTAPSGHYNEEIIRGVRSVLVEAYSEAADPGEYERIYISRSRARKRRILNEETVIRILAEFDFQTIYAEDLSFEEQVKICSRARYLVSNHGAGLTNMLFMPQGASLLELRHHRDRINNCYFTLSSALNLNYFYQTCQSGNDDQDPHAADLVVDPKVLKANLSLLLKF
jgi:capsular polysaccharide biosynthesis protein